MRVLIVEDEHKIANSIKKGLEQEYFAVDLAFDSEGGYDLTSSEDYDVIILDLMPIRKHFYADLSLPCLDSLST